MYIILQNMFPSQNTFLNCVCVCVCVCSTHRYCSAPLSIPGHTHTSPPYTLHSCCTVGGRPSGHTQFQSNPPRTDTHRHNRRHGCHSPLHTPLLERKRKKNITFKNRNTVYIYTAVTSSWNSNIVI